MTTTIATGGRDPSAISFELGFLETENYEAAIRAAEAAEQARGAELEFELNWRPLLTPDRMVWSEGMIPTYQDTVTQHFSTKHPAGRKNRQDAWRGFQAARAAGGFREYFADPETTDPQEIQNVFDIVVKELAAAPQREAALRQILSDKKLLSDPILLDEAASEITSHNGSYGKMSNRAAEQTKVIVAQTIVNAYPKKDGGTVAATIADSFGEYTIPLEDPHLARNALLTQACLAEEAGREIDYELIDALRSTKVGTLGYNADAKRDVELSNIISVFAHRRLTTDSQSFVLSDSMKAVIIALGGELTTNQEYFADPVDLSQMPDTMATPTKSKWERPAKLTAIALLTLALPGSTELDPAGGNDTQEDRGSIPGFSMQIAEWPPEQNFNNTQDLAAANIDISSPEQDLIPGGEIYEGVGFAIDEIVQYYQNEAPWSSVVYDPTQGKDGEKGTMYYCGCAPIELASIFSTIDRSPISPATPNGEPVTPAVTGKWLRDHGAITKDCATRWLWDKTAYPTAHAQMEHDFNVTIERLDIPEKGGDLENVDVYLEIFRDVFRKGGYILVSTKEGPFTKGGHIMGFRRVNNQPNADGGLGRIQPSNPNSRAQTEGKLGWSPEPAFEGYDVDGKNDAEGFRAAWAVYPNSN